MWPRKRNERQDPPILDELAGYPVHTPATKPSTTEADLKRLRTLLACVTDQVNTIATHVDGIRLETRTGLQDIRASLPDADERHEKLISNLVNGMSYFPHDAVKYFEQDGEPSKYSDEYMRGVDDLRNYIMNIIKGR